MFHFEAVFASAEPHLGDQSPRLTIRYRHVEHVLTIWLPPAKWWYFICTFRSDEEIVGLPHVVRPFRGSRQLIALSTYSLHACYVSSQCIKEHFLSFSERGGDRTHDRPSLGNLRSIRLSYPSLRGRRNAKKSLPLPTLGRTYFLPNNNEKNRTLTGLPFLKLLICHL